MSDRSGYQQHQHDASIKKLSPEDLCELRKRHEALAQDYYVLLHTFRDEERMKSFVKDWGDDLETGWRTRDNDLDRLIAHAKTTFKPLYQLPNSQDHYALASSLKSKYEKLVAELTRMRKLLEGIEYPYPCAVRYEIIGNQASIQAQIDNEVKLTRSENGERGHEAPGTSSSTSEISHVGPTYERSNPDLSQNSHPAPARAYEDKNQGQRLSGKLSDHTPPQDMVSASDLLSDNQDLRYKNSQLEERCAHLEARCRKHVQDRDSLLERSKKLQDMVGVLNDKLKTFIKR